MPATLRPLALACLAALVLRFEHGLEVLGLSQYATAAPAPPAR